MKATSQKKSFPPSYNFQVNCKNQEISDIVMLSNVVLLPSVPEFFKSGFENLQSQNLKKWHPEIFIFRKQINLLTIEADHYSF
jgi:hypothetical protein